VCFFVLHARLRVLAKHPAFPAPSLDGGQFPQNSGDQRREIADARFSPLEKITSECAYAWMVQCMIASIGIRI
jgi:hypothetical protein